MQTELLPFKKISNIFNNKNFNSKIVKCIAVHINPYALSTLKLFQNT